MTTSRWAIAAAVLWLLPMAAPLRADTAVTPSFRVFLKDGSSLASYGEMARVGDRVVFSMPTSASRRILWRLVGRGSVGIGAGV